MLKYSKITVWKLLFVYEDIFPDFDCTYSRVSNKTDGNLILHLVFPSYTFHQINKKRYCNKEYDPNFQFWPINLLWMASMTSKMTAPKTYHSQLAETIFIRERPLMTSYDFRRFLTYLPFSTLKCPIFCVILNPPTYPKIWRH